MQLFVAHCTSNCDFIVQSRPLAIVASCTVEIMENFRQAGEFCSQIPARLSDEETSFSTLNRFKVQSSKLIQRALDPA
eukprot:scaffold324937_cov23-Prasinocladus_malaysianus.AAC.1